MVVSWHRFGASWPTELGQYRLDITRLKDGSIDMKLELLVSFTKFAAIYESIFFMRPGLASVKRHEEGDWKIGVLAHETSGFHLNPSQLTLLYDWNHGREYAVAPCRSSGRCFVKMPRTSAVDDFHYHPARDS